MIITHDRSYLEMFGEDKLIEKGYAYMDIHSINLKKMLTKEEQEENTRVANNSTKEEWAERCDKRQAETHSKITSVINTLKERYTLYNIHKVKYKEDWDLFFSPRGGEEYDYVQLNFNKSRKLEDNHKLLQEIVAIIERIDVTGIGCTIQYTARERKQHIEDSAKTIANEIEDKFVEYGNMEGKIKIVGERSDGIVDYGFFKKRARSKYYPMQSKDLVLNFG